MPRSVGLPLGLWLTFLACNATIAPEQLQLIVVSLSVPSGKGKQNDPFDFSENLYLVARR
jgi:hypothetical protein